MGAIQREADRKPMSTPQRNRKPKLGSADRPRTAQLPRGVSVKTVDAMMRVMPDPTKEEIRCAARWWFSDNYLPDRVSRLLYVCVEREEKLSQNRSGFDIAVSKFRAAWEAVWEHHRQKQQSSTNNG